MMNSGRKNSTRFSKNRGANTAITAYTITSVACVGKSLKPTLKRSWGALACNVNKIAPKVAFPKLTATNRNGNIVRMQIVKNVAVFMLAFERPFAWRPANTDTNTAKTTAGVVSDQCKWIEKP